MAAYQWRRGSFVSGDAQAAGEVCSMLERRGELTPQALVDESRSEDAPLHGMFEWDDRVAAEQYRQVQARQIIQSIEVVAVGDSKPVKAFVSLRVAGQERRYESTEVALSNPDTREKVLKEALAELAAFRKKYERFEELADVIAAIKAVA